MKKQLILIAFAMLLVLPMVMAQTFPQNQAIDFKVSCGLINCTSPIITIEYPNSTILIDNQAMNSTASYSNYSFIPTIIGEYHYFIGTYDSTFIVTKSGYNLNEFNFTPMILGMLSVIILFIIVGIFTYKDHPLIALFLVVISFFLVQPIVTLSLNAFNNAYVDTAISDSVLAVFQILPWISWLILAYMVIYLLIVGMQNLGKYKEEVKIRKQDGSY